LSNGKRDLPGRRTLLNPAALISEKVEATTGAFPQSPSVGTASSVFPKFHPGLSAAKAAEAVMGVNVPVQAAAAVPVATTLLVLEALTEDVLVALTDVLVCSVVGVDDATELAVPGIHCE